MTRTPKVYSEDVRREAVRLTESGANARPQLARELGLHLEPLRGGRRRYGPGAASEEAPAGGVVPSREEENRRLRRENARLLEARDIRKKATAFFATDAR